MSGHPFLIYIFVTYSILFLIKSKTRNEFLCIFTLFMYMLFSNAFPNRIVAIITSPINIRTMDISLLLLLFVVIHIKFSKQQFTPIAFKNLIIGGFITIVLLYTIYGVFKYGYESISEFRSIFFYIIFFIFVSSAVKENEIIYLIKSISSYLIPLILLVPINLILTNNFSLSLNNRQLDALIYETITLGFLSGFLIYRYIDESYKKVIYFFPVFLVIMPYCSHRTTWAIIFVTVPFVIYWLNNKKYLLLVVFGGVAVMFYTQLNQIFLKSRFTAFTDIQADSSGQWRLLIWQAIYEQATIWGNGLGGRFIVYAQKIGWQAMAGAHNGFMQILYYLGYFGVCVIISLFIYLYFVTIKNFQRSNKPITHIVVHRLSFLSLIALTLFMIGYGADILSWIYISFSLKLNYIYKRENLIKGMY